MHFELAGKKVKILASAVTAFIIIFVAVHYNLYLDPERELSHGYALFIVSMIGGVGAGLLIAVKSHVDEQYKMLANTVLFFVMPIFSMQMVECFNSKFIWNFSVKTGLVNYMVYLVFYLIFYLITGRYHLTGLIVNIVLYVWALINYFVELFRGTPFIPSDIVTIKTGLGVADGYTYELSWNLILGSIAFFLVYLFNKRSVNMKPKKLKFKLMSKLAAAGYLAVVLISFFFTDFSTNTGYKPDFWNQARGYHKTGSFFNFCLNTKYLVVQKPSGYDAESVDDIVETVLEEAGVDPDSDTSINILTGENDYTASTDGETPNIIYIMNESWSDLSNLGDLETNADYMPFINSLTENTIKGYVTVPVFGAGTSNSEYEALTGNSISFLPAGCNVCQSYLQNETPSLVSTLSALGYSLTAYHPYYGSGWNRELVYPLLGFEDFISIEDFIDEDIIETYKANSDVIEYQNLLEERYEDGDEMLLRRFISDSYDYTMVEEMYENREEDEPFFIFNVTMQNHGGYAVSYSNFYQQIYATNMSATYPKANRYLSLVKETDSAFEELVEYFSDVDEPTIICMFGDHLPSIEDEFYEELMGVDSLDNLTTEQELSRYETPFVIWANYDIEEAEVDSISVNYLSTLLSQAAGLPQTQYNKYLSVLYQTLPVISSVGYVDADGITYASGEETPYDDLLLQYNCIAYNSLLDTENKADSVFYLEE
ncbi:MAG: LTA synthase family protein [Lachnospiraceae bacterium]|nr:LTA synthase family protein [Lachnospiraceae bacterium]